MAMIDTIEDAEATGTWRVRPGHAHAVEVPAGHLLRITDLFGKQMAACVAFNRDDRAEFLSVAATRGTHGTLALGAGTTLLSNRRTPLFDLVEETVGHHDALIPACDPPRYAQIGEPGHPNCRQALAAALAPYGIADDRLPDPVNWFMHVAIGPTATSRSASRSRRRATTSSSGRASPRSSPSPPARTTRTPPTASPRATSWSGSPASGPGQPTQSPADPCRGARPCARPLPRRRRHG